MHFCIFLPSTFLLISFNQTFPLFSKLHYLTKHQTRIKLTQKTHSVALRFYWLENEGSLSLAVIRPSVCLQQDGGGLNVSGAEASVAGEKGSGCSCRFRFQGSEQVTALWGFFKLLGSLHFCGGLCCWVPEKASGKRPLLTLCSGEGGRIWD